MEFLYSILATLFISTISLVGVILFIRKINTRTIVTTALISFAAGSLLGDAFIHLIGEHVENFGYTTSMVVSIFFGILFMLIFEAYFHCSHDSEDELEHKHILAKTNLIGDGVHNFLDGVAIASSFLVSPAVGIASTIAIIFHEIPQELADTGILIHAGWKKRKILVANFLTALTAILGVIVVFALSQVVEGAEQFLIPFAAGQFIYVALSDLVPEIHRRKGVTKYIIEISAFVVGFLIMYLLTFLES